MVNKTSTVSSLEQALNDLKTTIVSMDPKRQAIITTWINDWNKFIKREPRFKPELNIKYNAGDIVSVNFGYNIGSEQGGRRPAVVIEDNNKTAKTVMVVPLSSLAPGQTEVDVHQDDVYLGELVDFNSGTGKAPGTKTVAIMNQMRSISKMRITRPTKSSDQILHLEPKELQKIYNRIVSLYTKYGLNRQK